MRVPAWNQFIGHGTALVPPDWQAAQFARTKRPGLNAQDYWWKGEFALSGGHNIYSHTQTPNRRSCYWTNVNSYPPTRVTKITPGRPRPWSPPARFTQAA